MAISHIAHGEDGGSVRGKINAAIDKANLVDGKADQSAVSAETAARIAAVNAEESARQTADGSLQGQVDLRATRAELTTEATARQQADQQETQARQQADQTETAARIAADNARVTYAEAASEPTRPGEANRFFTSDLIGDPASVAPLPDSWKVVGPNGASIAIPGAGKVAPLAVWRVEPQRQYRVRTVVQRATNTDDPANDAIRIGLQWLDRNKGDAGRTICVDLVDITTASGRLGYFFNFATADADNIDFTAPAGAVYVRPYVQTFGSGITHVEVIETVDLSDAVEFSPDVSEWLRQLAGFNWRLEDATTRLEIAEENIEDSKDASWFETGTLDDARLSSNVMLLAKEQTVTKDKTFAAKLRMQDEILIGDGQVANPSDADAPTATARILGDGDHLSIAPTDKAGGYITLKEWTFSHALGVWLAEGGFRTTGTMVATEDGQIGQDLTVGRDASVTRHLTVGGNTGIGGDLDVDGSAQVAGNLGVEQDLGVLGAATVGETLDVVGVTTLDDDLSVGGDAAITGGATVGGALGVTGNATIGGTLGVTGLATLASLTVTGTATIGNDASDVVTIKGTLVDAYSSGLLAGGTAAAWRTALDVYDKAYVDNLIAAQDAMVFKGVIDCSLNPDYPAADRGWTYRVSVAGKIGGASGPNVEAGDILICLTDGTVSGDQATVGANWAIIQVNIDGALTTASIGVTVQGYDADLAAIAALTTAAYGRGLLTLSGAPALRAAVNSYGVINTDADATLTVGTDAERIRHTGTLTANRAVTLATAGAAAGSIFRITRTGGGAFNLNVGTGPLKALTTNTWATFVYDGAAWYLAEYGAL